MSKFAAEYDLASVDPALDRRLREAFVAKFLEAAGLGDGLRSRVGSMFSVARGHHRLAAVSPRGTDSEHADLTSRFGSSMDYFYGDTTDLEELDTWIDGVASAAAILYREELSRGWDAFA